MINAKAYLRQLGHLEAYIRALQESYELTLTRATKVNQRHQDVVVQRSRDLTKQEDLMAKMADLSTDIDQATITLMDLQKEAVALISRLDDNRYRTLLMLKYVNGRSWGYIAEHMGYQDDRWVRRMHGHALIEIEKLL